MSTIRRKLAYNSGRDPLPTDRDDIVRQRPLTINHPPGILLCFFRLRDYVIRITGTYLKKKNIPWIIRVPVKLGTFNVNKWNVCLTAATGSALVTPVIIYLLQLSNVIDDTVAERRDGLMRAAIFTRLTTIATGLILPPAPPVICTTGCQRNRRYHSFRNFRRRNRLHTSTLHPVI